jgi:5'-nucleotidase
MLRKEKKVDFVVAITHMRLAEDMLVSEACRDVDLILSGHDHDIVVQGGNLVVVNDDAKGDIRIVKSGTDFRSYSIIKVPIRKVEGKIELGSIGGQFLLLPA